MAQSPPAHLKARVGVSLEAQVRALLHRAIKADASRLASLYATMAADALDRGLDASAVVATAPYYKIDASAPHAPTPLAYTHFTPPLGPAAVRLLVFFLEGSAAAEKLHDACDAAVAALRGVLPAGAAFHASRRGGRHMTLYQTSHPQSLFPTPLDAASGKADPPGTPPPGAVAAEVEAARALAAAARAPTLVAHSIALARSGTLLLLLTESSVSGGRVASLRAAAAAAFPGCGVRQPAIMHVTLGRVLTPLSPSETAAAAAAIAPASAAVAGVECAPRALSHVCEETFATVAGPRVDCAWGG